MTQFICILCNGVIDNHTSRSLDRFRQNPKGQKCGACYLKWRAKIRKAKGLL